MFDALEISLQWIKALKPVLRRLRAVDKRLEDQLRRAAQSVALNLSEGRERRGRDRGHLYRIAAGSLAEARTALRVAEALDYPIGNLDAIHALADRLGAMTYRLTR